MHVYLWCEYLFSCFLSGDFICFRSHGIYAEIVVNVNMQIVFHRLYLVFHHRIPSIVYIDGTIVKYNHRSHNRTLAFLAESMSKTSVLYSFAKDFRLTQHKSGVLIDFVSVLADLKQHTRFFTLDIKSPSFFYSSFFSFKSIAYQSFCWSLQRTVNMFSTE